MNKNKLIFYILWILLVSLGPITVLTNSPLATILGYPSSIINVLLRIVGLTAFVLLFVQLILGAFMSHLTQKFGGWLFNFHIVQGIFIYVLVFGHPILYMFHRFMIGMGLDPFFIFTSVCLLCHTKLDFYYTLGRVAFWFVTIGVFAGLFRTATPFLRMHWRKFHILNYFAFLFVGYHSLMLGSDIGTAPFSYFHGPALVIISVILLYKGYLLFKKPVIVK